METIADRIKTQETRRVFTRLKGDSPIHNLTLSVRQAHAFVEEPERDKDGEIIRKADGTIQTKRKFYFRAVDIPISERWFSSDEDQEGVIKGGKVHELTKEEYAWLLRELDCFVIRFENKSSKKNRGVGPGEQYARARLVRYKRQDHERDGEFIGVPSYMPARGGKMGGVLIAVDVPLAQFVEIRRATDEDVTPRHASPASGGIMEWDAIAEEIEAEGVSSDDAMKIVAAQKQQIAELEERLKRQMEAEDSAHEHEKSSTRRRRRS